MFIVLLAQLSIIILQAKSEMAFFDRMEFSTALYKTTVLLPAIKKTLDPHRKLNHKATLFFVCLFFKCKHFLSIPLQTQTFTIYLNPAEKNFHEKKLMRGWSQNWLCIYLLTGVQRGSIHWVHSQILQCFHTLQHFKSRKAHFNRAL